MNNEPLRTCNHLHDTGLRCNSAAARGRDYCVFHLSHRARLMRMAQARAQAQRFDLRLPAIDSLASVVTATNQLLEAVSADMIDLKRADFLLKTLRFAAQALKHSDKWPASPFHSDQPVDIDLAKAYGLPPDINLDTPPETLYPAPPAPFPSVILSGDGAPLDLPSPLSLDLSSRPEGAPAPVAGPQLPSVGNCGSAFTGDYADILPQELTVSADTLEIAEIYEKVSPEAATVRMRQLDRNRHRRELTANRKRYEQMAARLNLRNAAERLAQKKLAGRAAQEQTDAAGAPPLSTASAGDRVGPGCSAPPAVGGVGLSSESAGCPTPPSFGGVGVVLDTVKKPPVSADLGESVATPEVTTA